MVQRSDIEHRVLRVQDQRRVRVVLLKLHIDIRPAGSICGRTKTLSIVWILACARRSVNRVGIGGGLGCGFGGQGGRVGMRGSCTCLVVVEYTGLGGPGQ